MVGVESHAVDTNPTQWILGGKASAGCRKTLNIVRQRRQTEILPPSDEGGGQRKALDGGREKQYYLHCLRIGRILSFSLPQSASQTAPSSEGAKAANDLFRQAE